MNTNGKAGKALKQANWETKGALKVSYFVRESTQVTPVAQDGNPRANAFYNTQIAALQTTELVNPALSRRHSKPIPTIIPTIIPKIIPIKILYKIFIETHTNI